MRRKKTKTYDKEGKKIRPYKKKGGIWVTNKFGKVRSNRTHPPKPVVKKCSVPGCDKRIKYHHWLCEAHWKERNSQDKKNSETQHFK